MSRRIFWAYLIYDWTKFIKYKWKVLQYFSKSFCDLNMAIIRNSNEWNMHVYSKWKEGLLLLAGGMLVLWRVRVRAVPSNCWSADSHMLCARGRGWRCCARQDLVRVRQVAPHPKSHAQGSISGARRRRSVTVCTIPTRSSATSCPSSEVERFFMGGERRKGLFFIGKINVRGWIKTTCHSSIVT
jgi:hypothetical protein